MGQRKRKTRQWLRRHEADPYVRRAVQQGYRSRAAFKLEDIDQRDRLLRPGMTVVELGAAPGGWTQYIARRLGGNGKVVAVDVVPMGDIAGVDFVHGDFLDPATLQAVQQSLGQRQADLVISDMAPKLTGIDATDQARTIELAEAALSFAEAVLVPGGSLLLKLFSGGESSAFRARCAARFSQSLVRKPAASRARSREFYLLNRGFRGS